jgi:hypothetical protein
MQPRRGGESLGRRTDKERGAVVAALAMAGRTQHRCRCKSSGYGTDDTADHRGRQATAPAGLRLIPRRGAAASRRRKVGTGRSGSHGHAAPIAVQRTRGPPVRIARWDSSYPARATGSDLSRSQFVSGRSPSNITGRETAPYGWIDGYLRRICNRGCRRRVLETPTRPAQPRAVREAVSAVWLWSARPLAVAYPKAIIASAIPLGKDQR